MWIRNPRVWRDDRRFLELATTVLWRGPGDETGDPRDRFDEAVEGAALGGRG
jgi:hypothetical protein